jgi:signal transduction histidine kinase/DNA-binding response OmpR family regulator
MTPTLLKVVIRYERAIVLTRQRARQIASLLGFDAQDQTRIATAVSEIARNAFEYARGGTVEFRLEGSTVPQLLCVQVTDRGPGIRDLAAVLEGRYRSASGMGLGITGARRLMDRFEIASRPGDGTTVVLKRLLPRRTGLLGPEALARLAAELARQPASDPFAEIQQQNQEMLRTLEELEKRQRELSALNRELEDTNRGVVALYAELDEKADHLRRADELKSRFLSNMSHEFRTPVNSIQALARMLLDRSDGELSAEQERQVTFIRKAADALSELVNDLLDLAKIEAGKIVIRPIEFDVGHLFGALRGMLRPLLVNESVALVFEEPEALPTLYTDEAKVSQILRNFLSNALKFTERGEVRVTARHLPGESAIAFAVSDTGSGIAAEDQERIFQEFTQLETPLQRHVYGTGLGLPLCRKLAEVLGGRVHVESELGSGSTFTAVIPTIYQEALGPLPSWEIDPGRMPVLVIEDSSETFLLYEKMLESGGFQALGARTLREARDALASFRPRVIVLDIVLKGEDAWTFLTELKRRSDLRDIPVAVVTAVEDERKALALGADAYCLKPVNRQRLLEVVTRLAAPDDAKHVLVADDEEVFRYVLRQHLIAAHHVISEAATGEETLRRARAEQPDLICLDLGMPDMEGTEVLRRLRSDPGTRHIPVVIVTAMPLDDAGRRQLGALSAHVLTKDAVSREGILHAVDAAMRLSAGVG